MQPRFITPKIMEAMQVSPVVFVNGARQSGKSTLVLSLSEQMITHSLPSTYVSFDKPTQMAAATAAPEAFLTAARGCMIVDEVQLVPDLFRTLKTVVDDLRMRDKAAANGKYLLTGSANILALPKLSDSLVGRMSVLTLYPFCTAEAINGLWNVIDRLFNMDFSGLKDRGLGITDAINVATYPEISGAVHNIQSTWFDGYITTLLQRDVRTIAELEKIAVLPHLLRLLASRAGNLLNDSEISRDAGLNAVSGKFYRNILQMMFLNFDVPPWFRNIGKRLVKSSKGYLTDTLLLCHMLDLKLENMQLNKPELFGHVLENYVATELTKQLSFSKTRAQLFHFRTHDNIEVDFILEKADGTVFAIEVKKSESVNIHDFKSIQTFAAITGNDFIGGIVLYSGKEVVPFGKNLWAVPYCILWQ